MIPLRSVEILLLTGAMCFAKPSVAQQILYLASAPPNPGNGVVKTLRLWSGEPVRVAFPPLAEISPKEVTRVDGRLVPVSQSPNVPPSVARPQIYRIVLTLTPEAQRRLQEAVNSVCNSRPYLSIAFDDTIIGGVQVFECARVEPGVTFVERAAAEAFAHRISDKPVEFVEPTPRAPHRRPLPNEPATVSEGSR